MHGHLHLTFSPDARGNTVISRQSFCAPMHLSKPHEDAGALVVNMVNPTAGLFGGDRVEITATVQPGAAAVLTTPSAGRVFRALDQQEATVEQTFRIAAGGFLEYCPELFIPHAGSRCRQSTTIHAAPGSTLLYFEWLSPGRVASGEAFAWDRLHWATDLWQDETLISRERYTIRPTDHSLTALTALYPQAHLLSAIVCGLAESPGTALESLSKENPHALTLGHTPLAPGKWAIRALCADSLTTRHTQHRLREIFYQALQRPLPSFRRQ